MQSFSHFLKEEAEEQGQKLKHITHAEDHPLIGGSKGFRKVHELMLAAHNHIKSGGHSSALTTKYDGSPSLVFGHHPENGKFFVASKSAFNVNPKINYTHEDVDRNHGHSPGLAEKLHQALNHLKKVTPKGGVYQGDVMFGEHDKKDSKHGVSFTPNTITYTARGDNADKVRKAKFGIVVHTQYHGDTLDSMKADSHPNVHHFTPHDSVWLRSAEHDTRNAHYSNEDQNEFIHHLNKATEIHKKHGESMYRNTAMHQGDNTHLMTYINSTVKENEKPSVEGFMKHIKGAYKKMTDKLKTPAAVAKKESERDKHLDHINANSEDYGRLLKMHHHLQQAKNVLVRTLNQHPGDLEHDINGEKTDPEGYVFNHAGEPTKLVNRAEFSRANLLKVRLHKMKDNKEGK